MGSSHICVTAEGGGVEVIKVNMTCTAPQLVRTKVMRVHGRGPARCRVPKAAEE